MSLFRRRTRRPQRSSDTSDRRNSMIAKKRAERMAKAKARAAEKARRRRQKPTSSSVPTRLAEAAGQFMSKIGGQSAGKGRKKTTPTPRKPRPTLTRTVDPMPNSPERQRKRNRKPAIDPPKGAGKKPTRPVRPKRDNKMVTPVIRRLANAKRLTTFSHLQIPINLTCSFLLHYYSFSLCFSNLSS